MEEKKIKLVDFFDEFLKAFDEDTEHNIKEKYTERKGMTNEIIDFIKKILKKYEFKNFSKNENYDGNSLLQKEYYRIDLIGWTQRKGDKKLKEEFKELGIATESEFHTHLWDMDIAIEHENASNDWMDEVIKLCYINCPLRIVIGYVNREKDDHYKDDEKYLKAVLRAINLLDDEGEKILIKKDDDFGIILGSRDWNKDSKVTIQENYKLYRIVRDDSLKENVYVLKDGDEIE